MLGRLALRPLCTAARALAGRPISLGSLVRPIRSCTTRVQRGLCAASTETASMAANGAPAVTSEEVEELRKELEKLQVGMRFGRGHFGAAAAAAASCKARQGSAPVTPLTAAHVLCRGPLQASLRKKEDELELVAPYNRSYGRTMVAAVLESESEGLSLVSCLGSHAAGAMLGNAVAPLSRSLQALVDVELACRARRLHCRHSRWLLLARPPGMQVGKTIRIGGWVKTGREAGAGAFAFLEVNDGSCFQNIQVGAARTARRSILLRLSATELWASQQAVGMPAGLPGRPLPS